MLTLRQVVFKELYPAQYTSIVATRLSNALLVGTYSALVTESTPIAYTRGDHRADQHRLALR